MPSLNQIKELLNNCTNEWITVNDINGRMFTSKKNGCSIFLPAAGLRWHDSFSNVRRYGDYWSSTLNQSYSSYAHDFNFYSGSADWGGYFLNSVC